MYPSGYMELQVRKGFERFGVYLQLRKCVCRMWDMTGVPCVHAVACYMHLNRDPDQG